MPKPTGPMAEDHDGAPPTALLAFDAADRVTGCSDAAARLLGRDPAALRGLVRGALALPAGIVAEEAVPLADIGGAPLGTMLCLRDRRAYRLDHDALRRVEERLAFARSAGLIGGWDWDVRRDIVVADADFARLYGVDPARAAAGTPVAPYVEGMHPEDRARVQAAMARVARDGGEYEQEYRLAPVGDTERWVLARGRCLSDAQGPARFPGVAVDVTATRRAIEALRDSEDRVALAVEAGGLGIWDSGPHLSGLHWDDPLRAMFGLSSGRPIDAESNLAAVHPDDRPMIDEAIARAYDPAGPGLYEVEFRAIGIEDGIVRWLRAVGRVRHDTRDGAAAPPRFSGVVQDVSRRKEAEAELRALNATLERRVAERTAALERAQAALVQAQKMEAVGQLTGGLAHDFNNLLTGITGAIELLRTRVAQGRHGELDRHLDIAEGAARRAASLTHRLLAFSRRQTLDPKGVDAAHLVEGLDELIRRTIGPGIRLDVDAVPGRWPTLVDPNQLENALLNLCINARDAMPDGGALVIETADRHLDAETALELGIKPGDYVRLSVTDSGTGMTAEVRARAFDPFYTTKPLGQGTGLGLSMIYGFARQSGGGAYIVSAPGAGTTVTILLPRHGGPAAPGPGDVAGGRARQGETVLVVDDEPAVRMLVTEALGELGYMAIEATEGNAGLARLREPGRIDLLITDVGLPGMNGRQLADAARGLRPDLPVLFITGYAETAAANRFELDPGMQVMTKPFAMRTLAARIRAMIGPPAPP